MSLPRTTGQFHDAEENSHEKIINFKKAFTSGTLPPAANFYYSKFKGVEWLDSSGYKITAQRGGEWLQIAVCRYDPDYADTIRTCHTFTGYSENGYRNCY